MRKILLVAAMIAFYPPALGATEAVRYDSCGRPSTHPDFGKVPPGALGVAACTLAGIGALGQIGGPNPPQPAVSVPPPPAYDAATPPYAPAPAQAPAVDPAGHPVSRAGGSSPAPR